VGSLATAFVGYAVTGVPFPFHLILALLAGFVVGGLWGAIPGFLKAYTGAHEVIVTIMLNYVAIDLAGFLLGGPMHDRNPAVAIAQTAPILQSARLPPLLPDPQYRVHWGVVLGVLAAIGVWWLLQKTTLGFEIRTVGANPNAARYAGISVRRTTVIVMTLSGGLGGLAGALDVVGLNYYYANAFTSGYGFDSIAVALLGHSNPFGVLPSALLFGALASGSARMQFLSQIPIDIIQMIQALILMFVAAPAMIRWLYRLRLPREAAGSATGDVQIGASWGKAET
jgi:simple sugar transport system permease protein